LNLLRLFIILLTIPFITIAETEYTLKNLNYINCKKTKKSSTTECKPEDKPPVIKPDDKKDTKIVKILIKVR
jgi:hypothetical protein